MLDYQVFLFKLGLVASAVTMPLDNIKTRLQTQGGEEGVKTYFLYFKSQIYKHKINLLNYYQ